MAYTIQVDQIERVELAALANGAEIEIGEGVANFDEWLDSVPEVIDNDKARLLAALGVGRK